MHKRFFSHLEDLPEDSISFFKSWTAFEAVFKVNSDFDGGTEFQSKQHTDTVFAVINGIAVSIASRDRKFDHAFDIADNLVIVSEEEL
jgi:hypothetical protein